jgi:ketosteroid isomerase-like protein
MTYSPADITQQYFAASNRADLKAVEALFQADATYSSAHTGLYYGITDIMQMMSAFFRAHSHLQWRINELSETSAHLVEVRFTLNACPENGEPFERQGTERLVIDQGLIRHIEIR